ncbi:putative spermidine/putrescine transport system substrate-binding protein [Tistlia consotensis]|uniref:Putative spermidine/putrescine transport system substrate-binding protein n=1 Tax=Tistlia consotensis USBA 355 TaxID=560819 RepID=A0A1Y6C049_9PROT|nr:ABC transporter substrate-binding protein [Tistlia consotensis]SMF37285.1 putative spermidine/putrescine transport system substrate-binding protein [Tistlia consotensis USBA 355]SNR72647.1 putative spermidine/putrescine transport system substrate-binding protein [Tistlia consotensis]
MRKSVTAAALAAVLAVGSLQAARAETLLVSSWGGSWQEMIAKTIGKKFTETTGAKVEFVTGGTIDRLNKAKLAAGDPETDITLTTSHVGWLYQSSGLFETLDYARIPNAAKIFPEARISPGHVGVWSYVYTIGYRKDLLPEGLTFDSWEDLWSPKMKGLLGLPDFDPSHIIAVSAILSGADPQHWEKGQDKLLALKPSIKAFYTNDASSQQMMSSGETPVQILLSGNAFYQMGQGVDLALVIPKEGAVIGIDAIGIMKGTKKSELAYKFIDAAFDPEVQAEIASFKKLGPMVEGAPVDPAIARLPGVFTTAEQWKEQAIVIDHKLRAEKLGEWKQWFTEHMIAQ